MSLWLKQESFTLARCRHIHVTLYQTGRGICTETCWLNDVFSPDDLMFSALVLKLAYEIYTLHTVVLTVDTLPWDDFVPGFAITYNGPKGGVSGIATAFPCGVWCRGLTT